MTNSIRFVAAIFLMLLPNPAKTHPTLASKPSCQAAADVLAGLKISAEPGFSSRFAASKARGWVTDGIRVTGPCASEIVAARASQFRLKSGVTVEMMPARSSAYIPLSIRKGRTTFDNVDVVKTVRDQSAGRYGELLMMSRARGAGVDSDRYVGVWRRKSNSLIGYVTSGRNARPRKVAPLIVLPLSVKSVYYFPSPDTSAGQITALARDAHGTVILWMDVPD